MPGTESAGAGSGCAGCAGRGSTGAVVATAGGVGAGGVGSGGATGAAVTVAGCSATAARSTGLGAWPSGPCGKGCGSWVAAREPPPDASRSKAACSCVASLARCSWYSSYPIQFMLVCDPPSMPGVTSTTSGSGGGGGSGVRGGRCWPRSDSGGRGFSEGFRSGLGSGLAGWRSSRLGWSAGLGLSACLGSGAAGSGVRAGSMMASTALPTSCAASSAYPPSTSTCSSRLTTKPNATGLTFTAALGCPGILAQRALGWTVSSWEPTVPRGRPRAGRSAPAPACPRCSP